MKARSHSIELLDSRVAPAAVVTYTDIDGDLVKITASAGPLNGFDLLLSNGAGNPGVLWRLDLTDPDFKEANITFTVTRVAGGDGLANVGFINGGVNDLGNVTVKGDLTSIDCGDGNANNGPSLKTLKVRSMGRFFLAMQPVEGDLVSAIAGTFNSLKVQRDLANAEVFVTGGDLLSVKVGGSVIGGGETFGSGGSIYVQGGNLGPVKVGRDVIGGFKGFNGSIGAEKDVASITIGGSLIGGAGENSGFLFAGFAATATDEYNMGPVKIGQDLVGGSGASSGGVALMRGVGKLTSITVGGSIVGGNGQLSGSIRSGDPDIFVDGSAKLGKVTVGGAVWGAAGGQSGFIHADGDLGPVKIGRDVHGGSGEFSGFIDSSTAAAVNLGGSLVGGSGFHSGGLQFDMVTGKIAITRSIIGGSGTAAGRVLVVSDAGDIFVGGNVVGGSISNDEEGDRSGSIDVDGIGRSITIRGSMIAGTDDSSGTIRDIGSIFVGSIGAITVKGNIVGNQTNPARITIAGKVAETGFALGKLTVGGRVEWAVIEALSGNAKNLTIGTVRVGGDWIASSLASGVNAGNGFYGDGDDALLAGNISSIASIIIGGAILGSDANTDSFAFIADTIGSFKAFGRTFAATPPVAFSGETREDTVLREL
jgi:hypothetical protein